MSLTPIVSVIRKKIDFIGGYYPRDVLLEITENIIHALTKHCMVNVELVNILFDTYAISRDYRNIVIDAICTHLHKVSGYVLGDPYNRLVLVHDGHLPEEVIFEVIKL